MAEYEHQFKVIDEAQKMFVVREMMPKDIKRVFLTGPRKFDEMMDELEIIINEMMADDGPEPKDLGNLGAHDVKTTQVIRTRATTCHTTMCARFFGRGTKRASEQARKDRTDQWRGIVEKELKNARVAEEMTEERMEI